MGKPQAHVVCVPAPAQGHINSTFKLAKLLHSKGFYITFMHSEFNFRKLIKSLDDSNNDSSSILNIHDFRFETYPDGLPPDNSRTIYDTTTKVSSLPVSLEPKEAFKSVLNKLNNACDNNSNNIPHVTCVIADADYHLPREVCQELGIRVLLYSTSSPCSLLTILHFEQLIKKGLFPLKDESYLTNGFLDTPIDWIPGLLKEAKLKHLPSFIRNTDADDFLFNYMVQSSRNAVNAGNIILNTFDELDSEVLEGIKTKVPNLCTIGPISLLSQLASTEDDFDCNLRKKDTNCLEWLDKKNAKSVIYVNYGSSTTLTRQQLKEFAWGLANSNHPFLWVVRDDLVRGESGLMNEDYMEVIKDRGFVSGWCPQEKVLKHPSVAVFLTHCGWNSLSESIGEGVPMICWPFFADQQTNCFYACRKWGNGIELGDGDVDREKVEEVVREMMEGEKGKEIKENALQWKKKAEEATRPGGSSYINFHNLVVRILENEEEKA